MADTSPVTIGIPPVTKEQVVSAVNDLAMAVKVEQDADDTLKTALTAYAEEFVKWQEEHSELVASLDTAKVECTEAIRIKSAAAKTVREIAPTYFADHPEARTETPGLAYRLERKPNFHENFVDDAVRAGATFLLRPDEKSCKAFVKGMAIQNKDTKLWSMPEMVDRWLGGSLMVQNDYVVTISEDKLVAPEPDID